MQVLGDMGKPVDRFSNTAVYGWIAPLVKASKPDLEWDTMEGTIVANTITVRLNGQLVHDNSTFEATTTNVVDVNGTTQGAGRAVRRGGAPQDPDFICIEPLAGIINGLNLAHKGVYKELQHIQPGGTWQARFWIRPTGF